MDSAGDHAEAPSPEDQSIDLVRKFSTFDNPPQLKDESSPQLVVLTGATGSLGAHILEVLRGSPTISQIICLVRGETEDHCKARVSEALASRKLPTLADSDKIHCLPSKLGSPGLGLAQEVLEKIRDESVCFIHVRFLLFTNTAY